jgi:hypothetical protein
MAVLDLSALTDPDDLAGVTAIENVATAIVPRSLAAAYTAIPSSHVANTVFVPDGSTVRTHTGSLSLDGASLGKPGDVLVVTGLLIITSPVTGDLPSLIDVTGGVLVPRGSEAQIGRVLQVTGAVTQYRWTADQNIVMMGGQLRIGGGSLANPAGSPDDLLVLAGQVIVTGAVPGVGYRQIIAAGQTALPAEARDVLEPLIVSQGQLAWYHTPDPRVFTQDTTLTAEYFRLLPGPASLVAFGDLRIADDVTADDLRAAVSELLLFGDVTAPPGLVPSLQILAAEAHGTIRSSGDSG